MTTETREVAPGLHWLHYAGWTVLGSLAGRRVLRQVCAVMVRKFQRRRGSPAVESRLGVVRLWRIETYREIARGSEAMWLLSDGTSLHPDDPVLELHIAGDRLIDALQGGRSWKHVIAEEFASLVPLLQSRREIAIVGSTILQRQVVAFGASVRPVARTLHCRLDTFYRKLILIAFHPGGIRRVFAQRESLADAAISLKNFRCRFAAASSSEFG